MRLPPCLGTTPEEKNAGRSGLHLQGWHWDSECQRSSFLTFNSHHVSTFSCLHLCFHRASGTYPYPHPYSQASAQTPSFTPRAGRLGNSRWGGWGGAPCFSAFGFPLVHLSCCFLPGFPVFADGVCGMGLRCGQQGAEQPPGPTGLCADTVRTPA